MARKKDKAKADPAPKGKSAAKVEVDTAAATLPASAGRTLDDPRLYLNRELSMLDFHRRVLSLASSETVPLLERLRFLTISCLILDEFFEVRFAGLKEQIELGIATAAADGIRPRELASLARTSAHSFVKEQYRILNEALIPDLAKEEIELVPSSRWDKKIESYVKKLFREEVMPVLTPVGLDPAHPFPMIQNKSLNFLVGLSGKDAFGRASRIAVLQAPRIMARVFRLPASGSEHRFVTLSSVIRAQIGELFPGMKVKSCVAFRVTRDSELWVDEEEVDDLLRALKGELTQRAYGRAVRLEVNKDCDEEMTQFLLTQFGLEADDCFRVDGPVNLNRLSALYDMIDRPDLKYPAFNARVPRRLRAAETVIDAIREDDVLLHHPFDSFAPVVELLQQVAADPAVLAIKMTLYRSGSTSPITQALVDAALAGKEVTAVVELRARFDEATNIDTAQRLQKAGAKVVYGIVGYKAHAKMILVVRREAEGLRRYVHLGTGNYHLSTSRAYTDWGLLTADPEIGRDAHELFQQLTGLGKSGTLERLLQSPFTLQDGLFARIAREIEEAIQKRPAQIRAKMNALVDAPLVRALYEASRAGVKIDLVIRGVCTLIPGIPGVSENIRVRSIVGRFLEHSRIFQFHAAGEEEVWLSSADWMPRNLYRRVEVAFPVTKKAQKARVIEEGLEPYFKDEAGAWELGADGNWTAVKPRNNPPFSAQTALMPG